VDARQASHGTGLLQRLSIEFDDAAIGYAQASARIKGSQVDRDLNLPVPTFDTLGVAPTISHRTVSDLHVIAASANARVAASIRERLVSLGVSVS